jgi:hypothetical protein
MTIIAKAHAKVGEVEYLAIVVGPDPEHEDCSIDVESKVFTARGSAKRWAAAQLKAGRGYSADIYERRWVEEEYTDEVYGHILDADTVEVSSQYGWLTTDGTVSWDPIWRAGQ